MASTEPSKAEQDFGDWYYNGNGTWSFVTDEGKVWETIVRPSTWLHDDPDGGYTEATP